MNAAQTRIAWVNGLLSEFGYEAYTRVDANGIVQFVITDLCEFLYATEVAVEFNRAAVRLAQALA